MGREQIGAVVAIVLFPYSISFIVDHVEVDVLSRCVRVTQPVNGQAQTPA